MTIVDVAPRGRACKYTGANSTEMKALADEFLLATGQTSMTVTVAAANGSMCQLDYYDDTPSFQYTEVHAVDCWASYLGVSWVYGLTEAIHAKLYNQYSTVATLLGTVQTVNNGVSRSIVTGTGATGFQVSASKASRLHYNVALSTTATIGGSSSATVALEICPTNSSTPGDWIEVGRLANSQAITLAVVLQSVQGVTGELSGVLPAGWYAKIRSTTTGTASATYISGQETLL